MVSFAFFYRRSRSQRHCANRNEILRSIPRSKEDIGEFSRATGGLRNPHRSTPQLRHDRSDVECARAVGSPPFKLEYSSMKLIWVFEFKYLDYWVCPKLGWGVMIRRTMLKIIERIASIAAFRSGDLSSPALRYTLFSSYVLPFFTRLSPIYPLFTTTQRDDLNHFYVPCLKRALHCSRWNDVMFAYTFDETSLHDYYVRC